MPGLFSALTQTKCNCSNQRRPAAKTHQEQTADSDEDKHNGSTTTKARFPKQRGFTAETAKNKPLMDLKITTSKPSCVHYCKKLLFFRVKWTYYESIDFNGVSITLKSSNPDNWKVVECTVIDANDSDANVVTFGSGEDANSVLQGFTVTGGNYGVSCDNSSSPVIINCLITDNNSAGIACLSGSPLITNNKIIENRDDGIYSSSTSPPTIKNR